MALDTPRSSDSGLSKTATITPGQDTTMLGRQMTPQLSPEQYERLFFQPSSAKGDLAERLGNPTLLGILGFLVPATCSVSIRCGFQGATAAALTSVNGTYYFFGGIVVILAGVAEFILGNTYPFVLFIIYGAHWITVGYTDEPARPVFAAFQDGPYNPEYNAGQGIYNIVMTLVTAVFLIGSIRTNVPFVVVFLTLAFGFAFNAAAHLEIARNPTSAGLACSHRMFIVAAGFGFVTIVAGWYLAIITVCASTGVPCPLPIFDLSGKVFRDNLKAKLQEHAGATTEDV